MKFSRKKTASQGNGFRIEFLLGGFAALLGIPNDPILKVERWVYNNSEESSLGNNKIDNSKKDN
jgi:hypothetical protein